MTLWKPFRAALPVLAIVALLSGACGGDDTGSPATSAPATAVQRPTSTATLTIVQPKQNQVIAGPTADLKVKLTGAEVVQQTTTDLQPDQGHLHVFLDGELVSMTSTERTILSDLAPGEHLVKVEFVANDHAPFDPRVIAAVSFEVEQ